MPNVTKSFSCWSFRTCHPWIQLLGNRKEPMRDFMQLTSGNSLISCPKTPLVQIKINIKKKLCSLFLQATYLANYFLLTGKSVSRIKYLTWQTDLVRGDQVNAIFFLNRCFFSRRILLSGILYFRLLQKLNSRNHQIVSNFC